MLEAVLFTTNLEHIGDIIDKGLLPARRQEAEAAACSFSDDGWRDIRDFHALIAEQMRRALAVFVVARRRRGARARRRRRTGCATRRRGRPSGTSRRLRDGLPETIETSALHLDVLRDLKRINAHLTTVAYPILEETGELRGSRLRAPQSPTQPSRKRRAAAHTIAG